MSEEAGETDRLDDTGNKSPVVKYKDPYTFLCSTRWRICAYVFLSFTLLYMHRVNLSLAVVCMVDTTRPDTEPAQVINRDTGTNHSRAELINSSEYRLFSGHTINITSYLLTDDVTPEHGEGTSAIETGSQCGSVVSKDNKGWTPELKWKKSEISILLSSYFYGSFFTQIPAGTMADIFGGKHIITVAMLLTATCSLLTPICARTSIVLMFIVRITIGLAGGAVIPAGMSLINAWSTPNERALMIAVIASGLIFGTIVTFLSSGLLCAYGFDNGWPTIFYIHGADSGITALFTFLWFFEGYSHPSHHPRISDRELGHIQTSKGQTVVKTKRPRTPWKHLLLSKPQWATTIAHFCFNWSFFTILINVPMFLKEVLKFEVKSNGLYSALPFVFQIFSALFSGKLSGTIIRRKIISHLATRRLFSTVGLIGIGVCLVCAGHVSCEVRHISVILLCLSCLFAGFAYGGFFANHAEYAGQFAGTAFGITNAGGVISSLLASMMAGLLTPNGRQEEWQLVFNIAAGVNLIGATAFVFCSDVHLQPWAGNQVITIEVDSKCEPGDSKTKSQDNEQSHNALEMDEIKILNPDNRSEIDEMTVVSNAEKSGTNKSKYIQESIPLTDRSTT